MSQSRIHTYTVAVAGTETSFPCPADDTITRAALRAGIALPYECNTGGCGTCKVELVSGTIDSLRPDAPALSERDRAKCRILGCQARPTSDCVIKARLDSAGPPLQPSPMTATLVASRDLTHDIREFDFELSAPAPFLPGQYALVWVPGVALPRPYSMSNIGGTRLWQFQIKRVPGGMVTSVLFDQIDVGASVVIDGPFGHAYLRPESTRDVVCVAGGSGLAPIISIARGMAACASLDARRLHFFYGGRTPVDICGEELLQALPALKHRYTYVPVVSAPDTATDWPGRVGFVHEVVADVLQGTLHVFEYYFAGPPAMALAVQRMLIEAKVPMAQMHFDQFF